MLFKALRQDSVEPDMLAALEDEWLRTGAAAPLLIDLISKLPSGGDHAFRRIWVAIGRSRAAEDVMRAYVTKAEARFDDEVARLTRNLTADPRPAQLVLDELEAGKGLVPAERQTAIDTVKYAWSTRYYDKEQILSRAQADIVHAGIGMRQQLLDGFKKGPLQERLRVVNEISLADPISETLEGLYGRDKANAYRQALQNEFFRLNAAARLNGCDRTHRWFTIPADKARAMVEFVLSPLDRRWLSDPIWARRSPLMTPDW